MAVAGANIKLNELLICPVCLDTYREARTLACLHSFCTECLQGCLRVLRRDIECPVCKRVTNLSSAGVRGLPADYRIEQIRDFLAAGSLNVNVASGSNEENTCNSCDVCKSQQRTTAASQHCVQCLMQLCDACLQRHNANPVLSTHHVIGVGDSRAAASFFCPTHRQQPIRYFCCQCHSTLCTICAIEHDPLHKPESLETGIINKYRCRLSEALSSLASRLAEVKSRTKRLGALRQSRQNDLYSVQQNIRERAAQIIEHVKQREAALLADAQAKFETGFSAVHGSDSLAELDFRRCELEQLVNEIRQVLGGPPQMCLTVFDSLMARVNRLNESPLSNQPSLRLHTPKSVCFIPAPESEMDLMIGCLQECSFSGNDDGSVDDTEGPSTTSSPSHSNVASPLTPGVSSQETCSSTRKRTASILGALSPARKMESRMSRMKGVARTNSAVSWRDSSQPDNGANDTWRDNAQQSSSNNSSAWQSNSPTSNAWRENGWRDESASARRISFDSTIGSTTSSSESPSSSVSRPVSVQSPASMVSSSLTKVGAPQKPLSPVASPVSRHATKTVPRLLFKIDQVGGLQGMIQCPVSACFVASGDVLVAECDRRIQLFDRNGRSVRVIGWGNIKPHAVSVGPDGVIAIAEKTSQTIRFYFDDGRDAGMTRRWPDRMFGMPCSVAVGMTTGQVIVADSDRRSVTIHSPGGAVMTRIGHEHLGNPTHVAVSGDGTVYVSDSLHSCIKVFDSSGQFLRQFTLPPRTSQQSASNSNDTSPVRPYGLCVGSSGQLYVCDRDGHRVLWYTSDGQFGGDLLQPADSSPVVKYPCDVAVTQSIDNTGTACTLVAVAESCNGLLDNDRHHAVKLFMV